MQQPWFKRLGWFHLPTSLAGVLISLTALIFCVNVFLVIDRHSHSVSDTLYGVPVLRVYVSSS